MMNNNNNTMNNNDNNDNNDNTMSNTFDNCSSSIPIAEAVPGSLALQQHQPGTSSALYKLAARNLREYHGVPSMTAPKLEKTVALLGLCPRRVVAQGLAPRRLLRDNSSSLVFAGESSDEGQEELREAKAGSPLDASGNNLMNSYNNSSSEDMLFSDDSNSTYDDNGDSIDDIDDSGVDDTKGDVEGLEANDNSNGEKKRPIHAALVAGGINLHPRETKALLRALGVSPHRLVKLGLVTREELRALPGRRGGGPGQHLRAGGPGKKGVGRPRVGGPRGPPHGPPHAHRCCGPSAGGGSSRPMHGPPRRPFHGAGHHTMHRGEESEEEGMSVPLGPHGGPGHHGPRGPHGGPGHHGPRHHGGPSRGPVHHGMPTVRHGRGPPGGSKHGHGHKHPPHGHTHGHGGHCVVGSFHSEGEGGQGDRLHGGGGRGPGIRGPPRHGGAMGRSRSPPHGPPRGHHYYGPARRDGASGLMHGPPRRPFHGAGHHGMHPREESEEEGMLAALGPHGGPRHSGSRQHGGERGKCRGRPQGPPHGPPRGPFHGLFHEVASDAPPGMMTHRRDGSPPRGGGGVEQRGGRHEGGTGFCGGGCGSGGDLQHTRRTHLGHFHGGHHQP